MSKFLSPSLRTLLASSVHRLRRSRGTSFGGNRLLLRECDVYYVVNFSYVLSRAKFNGAIGPFLHAAGCIFAS